MLLCGPEFWALAEYQLRRKDWWNAFPRAVADYKMDNNYNEYVREEIEITLLDIITENINL